jgi:hypothetical protein
VPCHPTPTGPKPRWGTAWSPIWFFFFFLHTCPFWFSPYRYNTHIYMVKFCLTDVRSKSEVCTVTAHLTAPLPERVRSMLIRSHHICIVYSCVLSAYSQYRPLPGGTWVVRILLPVRSGWPLAAKPQAVACIVDAAPGGGRCLLPRPPGCCCCLQKAHCQITGALLHCGAVLM